MKKIYLLVIAFILLSVLTGCLYPNDRLAKNQIPNDIQLQSVQQAVDKYREANNGYLPIDNRNSDTPIFQKYPIDFQKLRRNGLLSYTPGNSFEEGGYYKYVIIYPETSATVKVLDLRLTSKIRELNTRITMYRNQNIYPPFGEMIANGVYELDYKKLGLEEPPVVESPYTTQTLPILMDTEGKLYIDYRKDLYKLLREKDHSYQPGDDIRYLLTDHYPIVPSYSLPYTIENGEPVFNLNLNK